MKKRRRKKIPLSDRHPLERPTAANQVWSMDFVFDRRAHRRSIKNLTVVDDPTHEAVAIVPVRALGGNQMVRILTELATTRGVTQSDQDRQRQVILLPSHADMCTRKRCSAIPDRTRQAKPKRLHRIIQWTIPG